MSTAEKLTQEELDILQSASSRFIVVRCEDGESRYEIFDGSKDDIYDCLVSTIIDLPEIGELLKEVLFHVAALKKSKGQNSELN